MGDGAVGLDLDGAFAVLFGLGDLPQAEMADGKVQVGVEIIRPKLQGQLTSVSSASNW